MPDLAVTCQCGERFLVEDRHVGQLITCWRCKRVLRLKSPRAAPSPSRRGDRQARAPGTRGLRHVASSMRFVRAGFSLAGPAHRPLSHAARLITLASWAVLGGTVALALLMHALGDRWFPATVLLFAGRWIFAVPVIGVAGLALLVHRPAIVSLLLAAPITLFGLMGFETGWQGLLPAPEGTPLRVVTLNVGGNPRIPDELPGLLDGWRADIVALQECGPVLPERLRRLPRWHSHHHEGLCLLSRYPIRAADPMDRSALDRVRRETNSRIGGAGFVVRYMLDSPAGPLGVTNLHLETARKGLETLLGEMDLSRLAANTEIRAIEARRARDWADGGVLPMIAVGDFNAPPESRNMRDHWGDLVNAFGRVGRGFGYTRYNGWIRQRIDHVLHTTGVRAVRARVGEDVGSDHRPLIVDLRLLERISDR